MPLKRNVQQQFDIQPVVPLPSIDLFTRSNIQMSVQSVKEEEILPTGNWEGQSEIMFSFKGDPEMLIDPSSIKLYATVKIVNGDGSDLRAQALVTAVANLGGALFEKVQVRVGNSTQISGFDSNYGYLSYLETIFKAPHFLRKQLNFPQLIYPDTPGNFDRMDDMNKGFQKRRIQAAGSEPMRIVVPLLSPITTQSKLLPPNVGIYLNMNRAKDSFLIMSGEGVRDQKLEITSIYARIQKVRLNAALHLNIVQTLTRQPAIYPVCYQQIYEFSRVAQTQVIRETLFTDRLLPSYVYLMIVSTERRLGAYLRSPWNIYLEDLKEIHLTSGTDTYPLLGYKIADVRDYNKVYLETLYCLGAFNNPDGRESGITMRQYMGGGYALLGFNLTRAQLPGNDSNVNDPPRVGDLQVHVEFRYPLPETCSFMFVMEYKSSISISSNLDVTTNYLT